MFFASLLGIAVYLITSYMAWRCLTETATYHIRYVGTYRACVVRNKKIAAAVFAFAVVLLMCHIANDVLSFGGRTIR